MRLIVALAIFFTPYVASIRPEVEPNRANVTSTSGTLSDSAERTREAFILMFGLAKNFIAKLSDIFFQDVTKTHTIAGLSIFRELSLLTMASQGSTRTRLEDALGFSGHDPETIQRGVRALSGYLASFVGITMYSRNEIHLPERLPVDPAFAESAGQVFDLSMHRFPPEMFDLIRIEVGEPNELPHVVFFNYFSFNGSWENEFNVLRTSKMRFYVNGVTPVLTEFMHAIGEFRYGELSDLHSRFIEIPFKTNDKNFGISLFIIIPNRHMSYKDLIGKVGTIDVGQLIRDYEMEEVRVFVPKFSIMSTISSNEWIPQIFPAGSPFEPCANLSDICLEDSFNEVLSKVGVRIGGTHTENWEIDRTLKVSRQRRSLHTREAIKFNANYPFVGIFATTGWFNINLAVFTVSGSIFNVDTRIVRHPPRSRNRPHCSNANAGLTRH